MKLPASKLIKSQHKPIFKKIPGKEFGYSHDVNMAVSIRYDDECGNKHNSFSITADIYINSRQNAFMRGSCYDEIERYFPELAHLIKWHLCSSDGPMHYLANTLYHASDKDCSGYSAGEACQWKEHIKFSDFPISIKKDQKFLNWVKEQKDFDREVYPIYHDKEPETFSPKYTCFGYPAEKWHECPFNTEREALEMLEALQTIPFEIVKTPTKFSNGKIPELEHARSSAIWPNASLDQLQDKEALESRLPGLMAEFKEAIESLGFTY